jgi:hypothetical protein
LAVDVDGAAELFENAEQRAVTGVVLPAVHHGRLDTQRVLLEAIKRVFGESGFSSAGGAGDDDGVGGPTTGKRVKSVGKRGVFVVPVL